MKFDVNGAQQWVKQFGTNKNDTAQGVAVDGTGNVYITGDTYGSFPGNSNARYRDGFLMKFDANGAQQWVKQFGTSTDEFISGVAVDATGNAYIAGKTDGSFPGNKNVGDSFLLKFDANGAQQWVKQIGTNDDESANGVAIDATGNLYITGIAFGSFPGNSSAGKADVFLMKFDTNGISR